MNIYISEKTSCEISSGSGKLH